MEPFNLGFDIQRTKFKIDPYIDVKSGRLTSGFKILDFGDNLRTCFLNGTRWNMGVTQEGVRGLGLLKITERQT